MPADEQIAEAFAVVVELALALGVRDIAQLPGCWEHDVDGAWWIAINGHSEPTACSRGPAVPPFHVYAEWNGWPAGLIAPNGGSIVASSAANEDAFIVAIRTATERARGAL